MGELHYNKSLKDFDDYYTSQGIRMWSGRSGLEILNVTIGAALEFHHNTTVTLGFATPLLGPDPEFDGEFRLLFAHRFGRSARR